MSDTQLAAENSWHASEIRYFMELLAYQQFNLIWLLFLKFYKINAAKLPNRYGQNLSL
jgi:hypothetical protein